MNIILIQPGHVTDQDSKLVNPNYRVANSQIRKKQHQVLIYNTFVFITDRNN